MSIDFLRPFRSCFACNGHWNLSRIEEFCPHKFTYFHSDCLQKILDDPKASIEAWYLLPEALHIANILQRNENYTLSC